MLTYHIFIAHSPQTSQSEKILLNTFIPIRFLSISPCHNWGPWAGAQLSPCAITHSYRPGHASHPFWVWMLSPLSRATSLLIQYLALTDYMLQLPEERFVGDEFFEALSLWKYFYSQTWLRVWIIFIQNGEATAIPLPPVSTVVETSESITRGPSS